MQLPTRVLTFDLETTGLIPKYDAILGIGAAIVNIGFEGSVGVEHAFETRVRLAGTQKISLDALAANVGQFKGHPDEWKEVGRGLKRLFEGVEAKEAAQEFAIWLDDQAGWGLPVIAYNAVFDAGFYQERIGCYTTVFARPLTCQWIDVLALAKMVLNGKLRSYSLDSVLEVLGIDGREPGAAHTPLKDALLCANVYGSLLSRLTREEPA